MGETQNGCGRNAPLLAARALALTCGYLPRLRPEPRYTSGADLSKSFLRSGRARGQEVTSRDGTEGTAAGTPVTSSPPSPCSGGQREASTSAATWALAASVRSYSLW